MQVARGIPIAVAGVLVCAACARRYRREGMDDGTALYACSGCAHLLGVVGVVEVAPRPPRAPAGHVLCRTCDAYCEVETVRGVSVAACRFCEHRVIVVGAAPSKQQM